MYQNQLYPIAEGGDSRVVNACLEILRLNGKQESGISIDVMNSYTNSLIPGQAIYLIPGQAGIDGLERISFGTIRYLGVEDIKQIVSGDLTPLIQNV